MGRHSIPDPDESAGDEQAQDSLEPPTERFGHVDPTTPTTVPGTAEPDYGRTDYPDLVLSRIRTTAGRRSPRPPEYRRPGYHEPEHVEPEYGEFDYEEPEDRPTDLPPSLTIRSHRLIGRPPLRHPADARHAQGADSTAVTGRAANGQAATAPSPPAVAEPQPRRHRRPRHRGRGRRRDHPVAVLRGRAVQPQRHRGRPLRRRVNLAVAVVADPSASPIRSRPLANNYNDTADPVGDRCVKIGVKPADPDQVVNGFIGNWPADLGERPALWILRAPCRRPGWKQRLALRPSVTAARW